MYVVSRIMLDSWKLISCFDRCRVDIRVRGGVATLVRRFSQ
jgi:hypothetical protein